MTNKFWNWIRRIAGKEPSPAGPHGLNCRCDPAPAVPRWVPCEERLPEENSNVLVTAVWYRGNLCVESGTYDSRGFWDEAGNKFPFKVLAWMPLPEPYAAEDRPRKMVFLQI